jgi:hypothetical protein
MVVEAIATGQIETILDRIRGAIKRRRPLIIDDNAFAPLANIVPKESDIDRHIKHMLERKEFPRARWTLIAYMAPVYSRIKRFAQSKASVSM